MNFLKVMTMAVRGRGRGRGQRVVFSSEEEEEIFEQAAKDVTNVGTLGLETLALEEGLSAVEKDLGVSTKVPGGVAQAGTSSKGHELTRPLSDNEKKTKYQGHYKCKGWFVCPNKGCPWKGEDEVAYNWNSRNSWANTWQKCEWCGTEVYPYRQVPLRKLVWNKQVLIHHPEHLCGRCQRLGRYCKMSEEQKRKLYGDPTHFTFHKKMSPQLAEEIQNLMRRKPFDPDKN